MKKPLKRRIYIYIHTHTMKKALKRRASAIWNNMDVSRRHYAK